MSARVSMSRPNGCPFYGSRTILRIHLLAHFVVPAAAISSKVGACQRRTAQPPLARCLPSGEKAMAETGARCPWSVVASWNEARFQSLTAPSSALEARVRPSGEKATSHTQPVWTRREIRLRLAATSHNITVPSQLALASSLPSGEKASPTTENLWLLRNDGGPGAVVSHSEMVFEKSLRATVRPSGEMAIRLVNPEWKPRTVSAPVARSRRVMFPFWIHKPDGHLT